MSKMFNTAHQIGTLLMDCIVKVAILTVSLVMVLHKMNVSVAIKGNFLKFFKINKVSVRIEMLRMIKLFKFM